MVPMSSPVYHSISVRRYEFFFLYKIMKNKCDVYHTIMSGDLYIMGNINKACWYRFHPIIMIPHSIGVSHLRYHVAIDHGQFSLQSRHDGECTIGCTGINVMNACMDLKHICPTSLKRGESYMGHWKDLAFVKLITCRILRSNPLS